MGNESTGTVAERLRARGIVLPPCPTPLGAYVPVVVAGNLLWTSGMLPLVDGQVAMTGPVGPGATRTVAEGAEAARLCALNGLAAVAAHLGGEHGLDRIERVIQVTGHVLCAPDFTDQPAVVDGASNWLLDLFGDRGRHTRLALGAAALPRNASVELALVIQLAKDD